MDSLIDDSSLDRCQRCIRCQRDKPVDPNQPIFWPSDLCPECLEDVRMTWMQDDLDERGNLWREFVGLVGDWFGHDDKTAKKHYSRVTEADYQRGSQMLTTTSGGNAGGNTQASLGGHESPNEKRKRLKASENATVASNVSFGVTPTGLPKPDENARFKHLRGQKGNAGGNSYQAIEAFSSLSDLTALWPYLDDQQRETVLDVAQ